MKTSCPQVHRPNAAQCKPSQARVGLRYYYSSARLDGAMHSQIRLVVQEESIEDRDWFVWWQLTSHHIEVSTHTSI